MVIILDKKYFLKHIYEMVAENNKDIFDIWKTQIVFTWRWWLGALLTIVPWVVWMKIKDNKQLVHLLFVGLIVALITDLLDILGLCFGFWYYEWKVLPITPIYVPWDFTLFPVGTMLFMQFKPKSNKFIKAVIFSFFSSFVFEPIFSWLGIYVMTNWKYWYSFIIYIFLYLLFDKIYNSKLLNSPQG